MEGKISRRMKRLNEYLQGCRLLLSFFAFNNSVHNNFTKLDNKFDDDFDNAGMRSSLNPSIPKIFRHIRLLNYKKVVITIEN